MVSGNDVISWLNFAKNEDGIQFVGKRDHFQVGHIKITEKSLIKLNYADGSFTEAKTLETNSYSREQKRSRIINKRNSKNNVIDLVRFVNVYKINSILGTKSKN